MPYHSTIMSVALSISDETSSVIVLGILLDSKAGVELHNGILLEMLMYPDDVLQLQTHSWYGLPIFQ